MRWAASDLRSCVGLVGLLLLLLYLLLLLLLLHRRRRRLGGWQSVEWRRIEWCVTCCGFTGGSLTHWSASSSHFWVTSSLVCLPAWLTNECWRFFWWMHRGIAEYSDCDAWRWMAWGQSGLKWAGGLLLLLLLCFCFLLVVHVVLPSHIRQAPFCVTELWEEKQKKNGEVAVIRRTLETKIGWSSRHESTCTCVTEAATQCWICFAYKYPSDQISVEGN